MNVSAENLGQCKKLLRVEVPVEVVNATFDSITAEFQKQAQIPGFRPGKAPKHLVVKAYSGRIDEEVRKKLFNDSYTAATQQEKLRVVATLNVEELTFGRGMPFSFTATLEHTPDFALPNYKGLTAERPVTQPTDGDAERAMNILREQQVQYNDVHRAIVAGDIAVVNYTGTLDGKPITDAAPTARGLTEKQNFWVLIQPDSFIPGFTTPLIGASAGDRRTVPLTLPAEFVVADLSGKNVVYEVEVVGVKEKLLPVADDAFAKGFGAENLEKLQEGIRQDLKNELDFRARRAVRDQLLKALLEQVSIELPESVVANETRNVVYSIVNENQQRGVAKELIESKKDEIFATASVSAKDRVKAAFILNRIAEQEGIKAEQKEMTQRIVALAQQNKTTPEKFVKVLQERNAFPEIAQEIVTSKVLDFIELNAQVTDVSAAAPVAAPAA
jgi:trigger factor